MKAKQWINGIEQPLYSGPLLADDDCKINSTNDKIILKGKRDKASRLWMTPIIQTPQKSYTTISTEAH